MRLIASALVLFIALSTSAQTHKSALPKPATHYVKLLQATSQRILPGRKETPPSTRYSFIIKWVGTLTPEKAFWYAEGKWQQCSLFSLEKSPSSQQEKIVIPGSETLYCCNAMDILQVKKADYIEIMPVDGAIAQVPQPVNLAQKAIYFSIKNKWYYLPVNNITAKPDMVLP